MVSSKETTPAAYLASLPPDRRKVISTVRNLILKNLPDGYVENMNWGMLSYEVPLSRYPNTYNKQPLAYVALAAQKNNDALYMMNMYGSPALRAKLQAAYDDAGLRLDAGKSCLRFKSLDGLPLDVIAEMIAATPVDAMIAAHEAAPRKRKA